MQSILNQAPVKRLRNSTVEAQPVLRCPLEEFTGMRPRRPLMHVLHFKAHEHIGGHNEMRARQLPKIGELQEAMEVMHKDVA